MRHACERWQWNEFGRHMASNLRTVEHYTVQEPRDQGADEQYQIRMFDTDVVTEVLGKPLMVPFTWHGGEDSDWMACVRRHGA